MGFLCHFLLKLRKRQLESLPSLPPHKTIHHLTEDKPRQFCQNSNQQIACCSACPRQSATVAHKQSDGDPLNYREEGGPVTICGPFWTAPVVLSHLLRTSEALSCVSLQAEMLEMKAGPSVCVGLKAPAPCNRNQCLLYYWAFLTQPATNTWCEGRYFLRLC